MQQVRELANQVGGPAVAIVFDPHPASILRPQRMPPPLSSLERRAELLGGAGADYLVVVPTTQQFLNQTASEFFQSLIVSSLNAKAIVEGPNFYFGRGREGDVEMLKSLCNSSSVELKIVEPAKESDSMISSTRIRGLLLSGEIEKAAALLGRPHRIQGTVDRGARRGRKLGFPTANLRDTKVLVPPDGVYGGMAFVGSDAKQKEASFYKAAIHIGPNPTFNGDRKQKIEVHLLDFEGDLYDQRLCVDFYHRVRDIAKFDSADALVRQLNHDIQSIRTVLNSLQK